MRVLFMGTPDFSVPVLEALVEAGHDVAAVYCQPPRPAGRGKKERPSPVQRTAEALGLPVFTPLNFKSDEDRAQFAAHDADVAVVVAYGLILPQAVLDIPKAGCLNIHASLLPRWRGAAPIHRAIMAGDDKTGVCIMRMEAGLDTGPVLLRAETEIAAGDTTGSLHDQLSGMGAALVVEALERLEGLESEPQPDVGVTYAEKISKDEARIDWTRPASQVDCHIRGLSPFPGAWTEIGGERVKVLLSCVTAGAGEAGEVIDDALTVACGEGAVRLLRLQRAGKGAMEQDDFLRGFPVAKGTVLGR